MLNTPANAQRISSSCTTELSSTISVLAHALTRFQHFMFCDLVATFCVSAGRGYCRLHDRKARGGRAGGANPPSSLADVAVWHQRATAADVVRVPLWPRWGRRSGRRSGVRAFTGQKLPPVCRAIRGCAPIAVRSHLGSRRSGSRSSCFIHPRVYAHFTFVATCLRTDPV